MCYVQRHKFRDEGETIAGGGLDLVGEWAIDRYSMVNFQIIIIYNVQFLFS
jgi:hypothetical protein